MSYVQVEFPLGTADGERIAAALEQLGALSVTFLDRGDEPVLEPMPGEVRLWRDTLVRALFDATLPAPRRLEQVRERLAPEASHAARVEVLAERAWEREWLRHFHPLRFGRRLYVYPTAWEEPPPEGAIVVWLDPGLAFGTGTHPTTALCLEAIDSIDWKGRTLVDYGCGSGILAIAAVKLGAASAIAVDLDPQALLALAENARRNEVSDKITPQGVQAPIDPVHCVVANILAQPLIDLAGRLGAACRDEGLMILSGILESQAGAVLAAYAAAFRLLEHRRRDGWSCLYLRKARSQPGAD
ncbi:MAG: 50S ribosomal protein L11 methyltransferase [Steroidobacteraceae bacterium]